MLSICTQTAISVLHDIALGNVMQSVNYLLSAEEWKDLFDKLEKGHLIRCLPDKEPGNLSSYALWHPLSEISLLDVLQALNEPIRCNMPTPEEFYIYHSQIANKIGIFNQVARTFLADIKIADWYPLNQPQYELLTYYKCKTHCLRLRTIFRAADGCAFTGEHSQTGSFRGTDATLFPFRQGVSG